MERQFNSSDVKKLLRNKFVVVIGDSIHRSIYKDILLLLQEDCFLTRSELKSKGEHKFLGDELLEGGVKDGLTNGICYREVRQYKKENYHLKFYFVTRCYNAYMKSILLDMQEEPSPDIILMNSGLWDVSRYGKNAMGDFQKNLLSLFGDLNDLLPNSCLFLWSTTTPVSKHARGGFLPPGEEFKHSVLSADISEANLFAKYAADLCNIQILDLHSHLWDHVELQAQDGVHWDMIAHRFITFLILEIVVDHFGASVPYRPAQMFVQVQGNGSNYPSPSFQFWKTILSSSQQLNNICNMRLVPAVQNGPNRVYNGNISCTQPYWTPEQSPVCRPQKQRKRRPNRQVNSPYGYSPNCSQLSTGIESPYHSDQSLYSPVPYNGVQSPTTCFATPVIPVSNFQHPKFFDSPSDFTNSYYVDSPELFNSFENEGFQPSKPVMTPNNVPAFSQNSRSQRSAFHPRNRPCLLNNPNQPSPPLLRNPAPGPHGPCFPKQPYPMSVKSAFGSGATGGNNLLHNLGVYNHQSDLSGAMRHTSRWRNH